MKKETYRFNENDPEWIKELVESLEDKNINNFTENQKRMLRQYFIENLNNGVNPKDAIEKSWLST